MMWTKTLYFKKVGGRKERKETEEKDKDKENAKKKVFIRVG